MLADGQQTYVPDGKDPADYAKELAAYGVDIFAIGIGDEINEVDLKELISKPQHIFLSADISSLIKDLSKDISTALSCEGTFFFLHFYCHTVIIYFCKVCYFL